ncbi:hypothetical protein QVD17_06427 [Tagetes erecta]|uniref:Transcription repressor n=1 Tax=Tagetes erecta TaxID=13708 RepID=A0AAD8PBA0_TARER|nr:hypothetical protein QVD17_06427 [Tagetes erecta]
MVKFILRIFKSCKPKHSLTPPDHPSTPSQTITTRDYSPCKTSSQTRIFHSGSTSHNHSTTEQFQPHVGVGSRHDGGGDGEVSPEWGSPARLSVFKKLMPCKVDGRVKESFAVVKRSEKPYDDFKKSMMEMIVENEIYEESDLKQLLQCFLSLNSWYHHGVIMEAFTEIWNNFSLNKNMTRTP